MLALKYLLILVGTGFALDALFVVFYDLRGRTLFTRQVPEEVKPPVPGPIRWKKGSPLTCVGLGLVMMGMSIQVVPSGKGGVRISQMAGTLPGTLYPGVHFCVPLVQHVELYNLRDSIFTTAAAAKVIDGKAELEGLKLMAEAEDNRIRKVAKADAERMNLEAQVLKQNPLLIQKIIAERLSFLARRLGFLRPSRGRSSR